MEIYVISKGLLSDIPRETAFSSSFFHLKQRIQILQFRRNLSMKQDRSIMQLFLDILASATVLNLIALFTVVFVKKNTRSLSSVVFYSRTPSLFCFAFFLTRPRKNSQTKKLTLPYMVQPVKVVGGVGRRPEGAGGGMLCLPSL